MPSSPLPAVARAAHDLGLAGLLGGNLFGRVGLHPSVTAIDDPAVRGKVVNGAWRRYGAVNSLGLAGLVGGWAVLRDDAAARDPRLAQAKDVLVGVVAVTGLATAVAGVLFAREEPEGAVPLADGATPAPAATPREATGKRVLDKLGLAGLAAEAAIVGVDAALSASPRRRLPFGTPRRLPLGR